MKVSVALCTYNGEKYIRQQLESIVNQNFPVDEVVICDDRSTDKTAAIINDFKATAPFSIHFFVNEINLGSSLNFEKCLQLCQGEILILCDQDDLWDKRKVEFIVRYFEENHAMNAVFSDANIINESSELTGQTAWQSIRFVAEQQQQWEAGKAFEILTNGYVVTGATLALRNGALSKLLPVPNLYKNLIHDGWFALRLAAENEIGFLKTPVTLYRIHDSQQVGFKKTSKFVTLADRFSRSRLEKLTPLIVKFEEAKKLYDYLSQIKDFPADKLKILADRVRHFEVRSSLKSNRLLRIKPVLSLCQTDSYRKNEQGNWWKPMLGDLVE